MDRAWVGSIDPGSLQAVDGLEGRWKRFVDTPADAGGLVFGMGELAPGERAGWHEHPEPELFFVLEGEADGRWRDAQGVVHTRRLTPGTAFFKAGDVAHQMVNDGSSPFRGVFVKVVRS